MTPLQLSIDIASPESAAGARHMRAELSEHFAAIACSEHPMALQVEFLESGARLRCTLTPCCAIVKDELERHAGCAEELAAMHGLELHRLAPAI